MMPRPPRFAITLIALLFIAPALPAQTSPSQNRAANLVERARRILKEVPLVDGHNDLAWRFREKTGNRIDQINLRDGADELRPALHTDILKLRAGGVGGQFWAVYVPVELPADQIVTATLEQFDIVHRIVEKHSDVFEMASTADDIVRIHKAGRIASMIGVEGGHSIAGSTALLREYYRLGARYMTLTHSKNTPWADSATDKPEAGGLAPFGKDVVREMNRIGMLVDLSHVSEETMNQAMDVSLAPVIFSHSSARALNSHPRNVPDSVLQRLPANGGIAMVTFVPTFIDSEVRDWSVESKAAEGRFNALYPGDPGKAASELERWKRENPSPRASARDVADHIDHIRKIAGIDHIGIGSDFDGITSTPEGLENVAQFPVLLADLLRRGYSETDVKKIAGLNLLRVMRAAEQTAQRLQKEMKPVERRFDDPPLEMEIVPVAR